MERVQKAGRDHFVKSLAYERMNIRPSDDETAAIAYADRAVDRLARLNFNSESVIQAVFALFPWRDHPLDDEQLLAAITDIRRSPEDRLDALRDMEANERTQQ